jgi:hypothetical protein
LKSDIYRLSVGDDQVDWNVKLDGYNPPDYTAKSVDGKPWADPANPKECKFNAADDNGIIRTSFHGYILDLRFEQ